MKKLFATIVLALSALSAAPATAQDAVTYVPYNRWTAVPYCGGSTRLICDGPRTSNQCRIEFDQSYNCPTIDLYSGWDFYPTRNTVSRPMAGSFYVDNSRVNQWTLNFRVYMHNSNNSVRSKLIYQFNH